MQPKTSHGAYALATGSAAVPRLLALHRVYSPAGRRALLQAGLKLGMRVADFGCGIGATTCSLAIMVGSSGHVTGIDVSALQVEQARQHCKSAGLANTAFVEANAMDTGLPRESFDLAYCRFLLLHLTDPAACLREMIAVLKPGGILVIEDGDLTTAGSVPESSLGWFSDLYRRLGPKRGLDYAMANGLYHLVKAAGIPNPEVNIHQPAVTRGEERFLLKWSVQEAGPSFIDAGLITIEQLDNIRAEMECDTKNPDILILMPRATQVWGRKKQ